MWLILMLPKSYIRVCVFKQISDQINYPQIAEIFLVDA